MRSFERLYSEVSEQQLTLAQLKPSKTVANQHCDVLTNGAHKNQENVVNLS